MSFTGNEDHNISLEEAAAMTKRYQDTMSLGDRKGGYFGRAAIESILSQEGCVGIRYYYGLDKEGKQTLVLTGVKGDENDMYEGELMEFAKPCPEFCGSDNPLNGNG